MTFRLCIMIVGWLVVLAAGTGCAPTRPVPVSESTARPAAGDALCAKIGPRDLVRVTMNSGQVYAGRVVGVTAETLTLEQPGARQYREVALPRADIAHMARERGPSAAGVTSLTVVALLALMAVGIAAGLRHLD